MLAERKVDVAASGSNVDDAGAFGLRDIGSADHYVGLRHSLFDHDRQVVKRPPVMQAHQVLASQFANDLMCPGQRRGDRAF